GVAGGHAYLDPSGTQPFGGAPGELVCERALAMGYEADDTHGGAAHVAPATAAKRSADSGCPPRRSPRTQNSRLPSAPVSGDATASTTVMPWRPRPAATVVSTDAWTSGSRTMPPFPTLRRPASNWGFTRRTCSASAVEHRTNAGATVSSEMNERSA